MATKREYWGLDLETSGTSHERHVPIQLGIAAPDGTLFTSLIGGWDFDSQHAWDDEAFMVHGIPPEQLLDAPHASEVDADAAAFIEEHSNVWHGNRKVVGWNVAAFDMPFVRRWLPQTAYALSYQSADLNAICFALSEAHDESYKTLKKRSKEYAAEQLYDQFPDEQWHDAGYDAAAAIHIWDYLKERVKYGY